MAQIIKHRRGSLEALSAVTSSLVKGELVIASGSSNLTVTNGSSLVFTVPADGQVQATNRFLIGDAAPNTFASSTYNGMMKGVPYYASGSSTLYLLGTDGNDAINLVGNIQPFSSSVATSINALSASIGGGSIGSAVTSLNSKTGSYATTGSNVFKGEQIISSSLLVTNEIKGTGSIFLQPNSTDSRKIEIYNTAATDVHIKATGGLTFLGDDTNYVSINDSAQTITITGSNGVYVGGIAETVGAFSQSVNSRLSNLQSTSASVNTSITNLNAFSSSTLGRLTNLETTSASVNGHISDINTKTGSFEGKFTTLGTYTASVDSKFSEIHSYTSSLRTAFTASGANVTFSGNVIIPGNLTVAGTQTIVDSTTIQLGDNIIELNGSAAANGGLYVKDSTNPNTATGSIIWDSTNDYWKAGVKDAESKVLLAGGDGVVSGSSQINFTQLSGISANIISSSSDTSNVNMIITGGSISANLKGGVVSGSSQITISDTTGYSTFSSSIATNVVELFGTASNHESRIDVIEASVGGGGSVATRIDQLAAATASVNSFTASATIRLNNLESTSASVNSRLDQLSTDSGSQNTRITTLESKATTLQTYTASVNTDLTELFAFSGSAKTSITTFEAKHTTLQTYTASVDGHISDINTWSASVKGHIVDINTYTGSNNTTNTAQNNRLSNIETFTSSFGTTFSSSVDSRLDTLEGTGTIQGVGTGNNVTFASLTTTNNVTIGGDLVVQGNTVTLNTATLVVEDKTIQLASGSTNAAQANGAGIEVMGASATFTYDSTPNAWTANIPISASAFTGSFNLPAGGSSKRIAFRTATGNLDVVTAPTTNGDVLQWNGTDFVMSNTIDGGSF